MHRIHRRQLVAQRVQQVDLTGHHVGHQCPAVQRQVWIFEVVESQPEDGERRSQLVGQPASEDPQRLAALTVAVLELPISQRNAGDRRGQGRHLGHRAFGYVEVVRSESNVRVPAR